MIDSNKRTAAGSIGVLRTNSFICCVSTLPGFLGGTIAIMKSNTDGEIVKWPKAEHEAQEWQAAMEALILVASSGAPTMFARIAIIRTLTPNVERAFT